MLVPMTKEQFIQRMLEDARREKEKRKEQTRVVTVYLIEKANRRYKWKKRWFYR